jgi:hypothetical protein
MTEDALALALPLPLAIGLAASRRLAGAIDPDEALRAYAREISPANGSGPDDAYLQLTPSRDAKRRDRRARANANEREGAKFSSLYATSHAEGRNQP